MVNLFAKIKKFFHTQTNSEIVFKTYKNVEITANDVENTETIYQIPESDVSFLRHTLKMTKTFYYFANRYYSEHKLDHSFNRDETNFFTDHMRYYVRNHLLFEMNRYARDIDMDISHFQLPPCIIQDDRIHVYSRRNSNGISYIIKLQIDDVLFQLDVGRHRKYFSISVNVDSDDFNPIVLLKTAFQTSNSLIWNDVATDEIKKVIYKKFSEIVEVNEQNGRIFSVNEEKIKAKIREQEDLENQKDLSETQLKIKLLNQKLGIVQ